jgi:phage tail-like protein
MATGDRKDPYRGYNFRLEIDNSAVAGFSECGGLTADTDPVDYREGTDVRLSVRKLTGLRKFSNISLKRGYTDNKELWNWYKNILNGTTDRRNGAIVLQDELHADVLRWNWSDGWVTKYEGPAFNAHTNDVTIEHIEIVVERVELQ